jgi:hypothetical protein
MAEYHAFINRLQQVRAGMQRLHAVKAAGHLQPGVAAVEKRQKKTRSRLSAGWRRPD